MAGSIRRRGRLAAGALGLAAVLLLAGCSYTPARLETGPLVEFGGYHDGHRHHERDHRRYRHRDHGHRRYDDHDRHDRDRHHHRRQRHHGDDRHRGRFCPPGLAMQGRC